MSIEYVDPGNVFGENLMFNVTKEDCPNEIDPFDLEPLGTVSSTQIVSREKTGQCHNYPFKLKKHMVRRLIQKGTSPEERGKIIQFLALDKSPSMRDPNIFWLRRLITLEIENALKQNDENNIGIDLDFIRKEESGIRQIALNAAIILLTKKEKFNSVLITKFIEGYRSFDNVKRSEDLLNFYNYVRPMDYPGLNKLTTEAAKLLLRENETKFEIPTSLSKSDEETIYMINFTLQNYIAERTQGLKRPRTDEISEIVMKALENITKLHKIKKTAYLERLENFFMGKREQTHCKTYAQVENVKNTCAFHVNQLFEFINSFQNEIDRKVKLERLDEMQPVCMENLCSSIEAFILQEKGEFQFDFDETLDKLSNISNCANALRNSYCYLFKKNMINEEELEKKFKQIGPTLFNYLNRRAAINGHIALSDINSFLKNYGEQLLHCIDMDSIINGRLEKIKFEEMPVGTG